MAGVVWPAYTYLTLSCLRKPLIRCSDCIDLGRSLGITKAWLCRRCTARPTTAQALGGGQRAPRWRNGVRNQEMASWLTHSQITGCLSTLTGSPSYLNVVALNNWLVKQPVVASCDWWMVDGEWWLVIPRWIDCQLSWLWPMMMMMNDVHGW